MSPRISAFHPGFSWDFFDSGYAKRTDPDRSVHWFKGPPGLPFADNRPPIPCDPPTHDHLYPTGHPPRLRTRVIHPKDGPGIIFEPLRPRQTPAKAACDKTHPHSPFPPGQLPETLTDPRTGGGS